MEIQENKPLISEREILAQLGRQKDIYAPLKIVSIKTQPGPISGYRPDAEITLGLGDRQVVFIVEVKARSTPKIVAQSLWQIKSYAKSLKKKGILLVPYLSNTIVEMLNMEGLSGIDLSGNYWIQTPELIAIRRDQKNRFPESKPIKKIFSGNSSIVGRLFLAGTKRIGSVNQVHSMIQEKGGSLSLSAVSKVLKGFKDELIIEKGDQDISLLQPEKLLDRLAEEYRPPKITAVLRLKLPAEGLAAIRSLNSFLKGSIRCVLTGESSTERYAIMPRMGPLSMYVTDVSSLTKFENERFPNVIAKQTADSFPYFDAVSEAELAWASPIQCYLELSKLDKREKEAALPLRQMILEKAK